MKKIILMFLLFASSLANAAAPISNGWYYPPNHSGGDPDAVALSACKATWSVTTNVVFTVMQDTARNYTCRTDTGSLGSRIVSPASYCQYGGVPNTSLPLEQQCPDPPINCTPGRQFDTWVSQGTAIPGTSTTTDMGAPKNLDGCRVYASEIYECLIGPGDEVFCKWKLTEGGEAPSGEAPDSTSTPPVDSTPTDVPQHNPALGQGCPKGTVNLGTDSTGGSICGGSGSSPSTAPQTEVTEPPVTTNNPDGSTSVSNVTTRTNSDGSVTTTTTTTTTGADGKVTKTTSSVTGDKPGSGEGGTGGTGGGSGQGKDDSSDEKKDDFCLKNPNLNICKNSEVTGSCESVACTGDAIQCAIYRQQQKEYCENRKEDPMRTLGQQMLAGQDPLMSTFPTKENARVVDIPSLNQNAFLGGGACFDDVSITVSGMSFVLPISDLCDYLIGLRGLVMLLAALASWRLVSKSILG